MSALPVMRIPVATGLAVACLAGCTDTAAAHRSGSPSRTVVTGSGSTSPSVVAMETTPLPPQTPVATWQLHGAPFGFTTGPRLTVGPALRVGKDIGLDHEDMREVVLVFPPPHEPSRCIERADLTVTALTVDGAGAEIAVYPSDEANYLAAASRANAQLDISRLIDNRPRGYVPTVRRGAVDIDVTDLYRTWARWGPFPSQGRRLRRHTPFGVVLRPSTAENGRWSITVANTARRRPRLLVRVEDGCRR